MSKKSIEIGDVFGTWTVIAHEENSDKKYNYNYLCQCDCGNKKVIRKDKLLNYSFGRCDRCLSMSIINNKKDLIKSRWNDIINGKLINYTKLDTNKKYSWRCEHGHTYESSIMMLNNQCPKCKSLEEIEDVLEEIYLNFDKLVYLIDEVTLDIFGSDMTIEIEGVSRIMRMIFNDYVVVCVPYLHMQYFEGVHGSKKNFMEIQGIIRDLYKEFPEKELIKVELTMDYNADRRTMVDVLKHLKSRYVAL